MRQLAATLLALFVLLFSAGCSSDLGKRCVSDNECDAPLQCLPVEGAKGVCSYATPAKDAASEALVDGNAAAE